MIDVLLNDFDPDVVVWSIRAFYIFAAYAIIIVAFIPDLKQRFLDYGPRSGLSTKGQVTSSLPQWLTNRLDPNLNWLSTFTVPHSWFFHFYICSTICSTFWLMYVPLPRDESTVGQPVLYLASEQGRTILALALLSIQGLRRLYECLCIAKTSSSKMWIGHYAIGIAFYIVTNVAIWIEPGELRC